MNRSSHRFDTIASNYANSEVHSTSPTIDKLQGLLGSQRFDHVLDVASGAGYFGLAFADRAGRLTAVDPAPKMREAVRTLAQRRDVAVETVDGRAESLPFADETFDLTLCRLAAHHFTDIQLAISEMKRVTRRGGILAIIDLQGSKDAAADAINHEIELLHDPTHVRSYRVSDWSAFLAANQLTAELYPDQSEFPDGLSVSRWCEIAASGADAAAKIRDLLAASPAAILDQIGIRPGDNDHYLSIRTLLVIAHRAAEQPAPG